MTTHTNSLPCIGLNRYAQERAKKKHPWVFSNEIQDMKHAQKLPPGSLVDVLDCHGGYIGTGFVNPKSLITVRLLTRERGEAIDADFFRNRIEAALRTREPLYGKKSTSAGTYRAVFGESDGLPGLVIDRFQGAWVVEPHAFGMFARKKEIIEALRELAGKDAIVFRTDHRSAQLEGMAVESELVHGEIPKSGVFAVEDGIRFPVDPLKGQKTGFFFDQRENRAFFRNYIEGAAREGKQVQIADLFCHLGAWGLRSLKAGAAHVTFVDSSGPALDAVRAAAKELGVLDKADFVESDVLTFLKAQKAGACGALVVDPPALVPSKKDVAAGSKAYRELNAQAFRIVRQGGVVSSSSCSYHMPEERFEEVLAKAALDSNREAKVIYRGGMSADHPFLPGMEEGRYLKNLFLVAK
ncbi:MAG: class I SAM-dependent rRNA methyltransferase [Bacteriovoracia bacterium]